MASSSDKPPIWSQPEPGSRRPRFSREQIAATALAIADAEGFEAVSMRRLASELGAGTMTLYHYVRTKDDLVALMDDAMMAKLIIPDSELPKHWRAAMTAIARRTREALLRHPWVLHSLQNAGTGPNAMRHVEQCLVALSNTELEVRQKLTVLAVVDDYVSGNVLRTVEQRAREKTDPAAVQAMREFGRAQLATGGYPEMVRLFGGDTNDELGGLDWFEAGLQALFDGLAVRLGLPTAD